MVPHCVLVVLPIVALDNGVAKRRGISCHPVPHASPLQPVYGHVMRWVLVTSRSRHRKADSGHSTSRRSNDH